MCPTASMWTLGMDRVAGDPPGMDPADDPIWRTQLWATSLPAEQGLIQSQGGDHTDPIRVSVEGAFP